MYETLSMGEATASRDRFTKSATGKTLLLPAPPLRPTVENNSSTKNIGLKNLLIIWLGDIALKLMLLITTASTARVLLMINLVKLKAFYAPLTGFALMQKSCLFMQKTARTPWPSRLAIALYKHSLITKTSNIPSNMLGTPICPDTSPRMHITKF